MHARAHLLPTEVTKFIRYRFCACFFVLEITADFLYCLQPIVDSAVYIGFRTIGIRGDLESCFELGNFTRIIVVCSECFL